MIGVDPARQDRDFARHEWRDLIPAMRCEHRHRFGNSKKMSFQSSGEPVLHGAGPPDPGIGVLVGEGTVRIVEEGRTTETSRDIGKGSGDGAPAMEESDPKA
jgi:hypothetical protein